MILSNIVYKFSAQVQNAIVIQTSYASWTDSS